MLFKTIIYKIIVVVSFKMETCIHHLITNCILWFLNVPHKRFKTTGIPFIRVSRGGGMSIGDNFSMHNGLKGNPIGCYQRCTFIVDNGAKLIIGDNVGISQSALIAADDIIIENDVKIGGGCCVWTTDFHSLNPMIRASEEDLLCRAKAPTVIMDNAFIGAKSIILKGVTIGRNSIIGAGSVVTKNIPENEIWAGNPAKFIRKLKSDE